MDGVVRASFGLAHIDHAVSFECHQSIEIVGGQHAGRLFEPTQVGGVAPDLVGTGGMDPDELEVRPLNELAQGVTPHIAGRELDYP